MCDNGIENHKKLADGIKGNVELASVISSTVTFRNNNQCPPMVVTIRDPDKVGARERTEKRSREIKRKEVHKICITMLCHIRTTSISTYLSVLFHFYKCPIAVVQIINKRLYFGWIMIDPNKMSC